MKVKKILVISLLVISILTICAYFIVIPQVTFTGQVEDVYDSSLLVTAKSGALSSGQFQIRIDDKTILLDSNNNPIEIDSISAFNTISVIYYGGILESNPGIITHCYRIKVLE
ncbi:MAG: YobA family protein [Firmicutes bacterium]|nr:YobA family protein [Bacillota bacterium]